MKGGTLELTRRASGSARRAAGALKSAALTIPPQSQAYCSYENAFWRAASSCGAPLGKARKGFRAARIPARLSGLKHLYTCFQRRKVGGSGAAAAAAAAPPK